jgi:electron transfer flavoprotein beta subunit
VIRLKRRFGVNIFVFVKRVPDSESKIRIDHENNRIVEDDLNFVLNPYDEFAVEEALQIKENQGGKVTALSVGPDEAVPTLKRLWQWAWMRLFLSKTILRSSMTA